MLQNSERSDYMEVIRGIKTAEETHEKILSDARVEAEKIILKSKQTALEERTKIEEQVVAFKNEKLRAGIEDIDALVKKAIEKAKVEAAKLNKKILDTSSVSRLVSVFLNSLD